MEIQLLHNYPVSSTTRIIRKGKLVDIILSGSTKNQKEWASIRGIVSGVYSNAINVQISSLGDNFLLKYFVDKRYIHLLLSWYCDSHFESQRL